MADFLQNNDFWQVPLVMGKKKIPKKSKAQHQPSLQAEKKASQPEVTEKDERFDFGGLPDRNLKKNLGCG